MDRDLEKLKTWIVRKKLQGCSVTEICTSARISRDMFYRWWNRYQQKAKTASKKKREVALRVQSLKIP